MKKAFVPLALAASLSLAAGSALASEPLEAFYTGTLHVTQPNGVKLSVWFDPDNTYRFALPDGTLGKGTWRVADGKICTTRMEPTPAPEQCVPDEGMRKHGEAWELATPAGPVKYHLAAGR